MTVKLFFSKQTDLNHGIHSFDKCFAIGQRLFDDAVNVC